MPLPRFLAALALVLLAQCATAAPCASEDFETHVSGLSQCLLMRRFGPLQPEVIVVWLHGDLSSGAPANYHFGAAQAAATAFAGSTLLSIALVRPGYPDGGGESSSVAMLHSGRADHYSAENLVEVGTAIARLREHFHPASVIAVGHSGGAATAAVLLGMMPGLIDAALLVSCPCDLVAWRSGRRAWSRSENPIRWADKVSASARVIALAGSADGNTPPALSRAYVDALQARGVAASLEILPDATHDGAFRAAAVGNALQRLMPAKPGAASAQ
jgi:pimeloyl-ACP methyl ester carboxylesterase